MNEKSLNDLIVSGIRKGKIDLDLNDKIVDSFLEQGQAEITDQQKSRFKARLRSKIVEAAIASARTSTPWKGVPFGRYIEDVRSRAGLARIDVAEFLGQSDEYLQRIERGDANPTQIPTNDVVTIVELFHIKLKPLSEMLTAAVYAAQKRQGYRAAARSHGGLRTDVRSEDVERALDAFTRKRQQQNQNAIHGDQSKSAPEISHCLARLAVELKKRGRDDLLS